MTTSTTPSAGRICRGPDSKVYVNRASAFTGVTSTNPQHTVSPTALTAGATIELWVGPSGSGLCDNTPVTPTIQAQ
ncbi:MAG: hypothetical protein KJ015_18815 [Myxococcales bacterium]|nr:hypothetical protein [Myxococcales bacterium]